MKYNYSSISFIRVFIWCSMRCSFNIWCSIMNNNYIQILEFLIFNISYFLLVSINQSNSWYRVGLPILISGTWLRNSNFDVQNSIIISCISKLNSNSWYQKFHLSISNVIIVEKKLCGILDISKWNLLVFGMRNQKENIPSFHQI